MKEFWNKGALVAGIIGCIAAFIPAQAADESPVRLTNSAAQARAAGLPTLSIGNETPIVAPPANRPLSTNIIRFHSPLPEGFAPKVPLATGLLAATNVTYEIPTNSILEFQVPLTQAAQMSLANTSAGVMHTANAGIAVPAGFNPTNMYPLLLVSATSDGDASSITAMRSFTNVALRLGFVVAAADGSFGRPVNDTPIFRFAMLTSVLEHMHKSWPASRSWPIVCAGFSGGAKWSGVIGAGLNGRGYRVMGVFQGGVNQDFTTEATKMYSPALRYRSTPFYLSSGAQDKVATPQQHEEVRRSLLATGFNMVRLESHEGGHSLDQDHLEKAFNWFVQVYRLQTAHATAASTNEAVRATSTGRKNTNVARSTGANGLSPFKTNRVIRSTKPVPVQ